jgi:uncharacterized Fe-S radical SAM superfamily protein PflX
MYLARRKESIESNVNRIIESLTPTIHHEAVFMNIVQSEVDMHSSGAFLEEIELASHFVRVWLWDTKFTRSTCGVEVSIALDGHGGLC